LKNIAHPNKMGEVCLFSHFWPQFDRNARMFLRLLLVFSFLLPTSAIQAQYFVKGVVFDIENGQKLSFVNIVINDSRNGSTTDIDGKFELTSAEPIQKLQFSYVGYELLQYFPNGHSKVEVGLMRKNLTLAQIEVIAGENPAHRIIRTAIANRDKNDPEKLSSFRYTAYNKFIVSVDTGEQVIDTIAYQRIRTKAGNDSLLLDSAAYKMGHFFRKRDFFLNESVSQRVFRSPDLNNEKVIASRTSGFKSPDLILLSSQLQSFSFYKDYIEILQTRYLNPLAPGSTSRYFFQIEDTTYHGADTVYIISFKPVKGKNFTGMQGLLYINTHGYALEHVIARPADSLENMSISIRQQYKLVGGQKWFPDQLHTDIRFGTINLNGIQPVAYGRSYLRDIELEPAIGRRDIGMNGIEIEKNAHEQPNTFWNNYRIEGDETRDRETYRFIDSLSEALNLDRRFRFAMALTTGRLPIGPVDLRLKEMLLANRYEGFRLGLSVATNDKVSRYFSVGAYGAFGFQDRQGKYGANADVYFDGKKNWTLTVSHKNDLEESGGYSFFSQDAALFSSDSERLWQLFRQYFDRNQRENEVKLQFLNQRDLSGTIGLRSIYKVQTPWYRYRYLGSSPEALQLTDAQKASIAPNNFQYTEFKIQLRYAFREKYVKLSSQQYSMGTSYPVVSVNYYRGLSVGAGNFNYDRLVLKIDKTLTLRHTGTSEFQISGGWINGGELPLNLLFFARGVGRLNGIYVPHTFQTIDANDFVHDRFINLQWRHNFESLLFRTKKQAPQFAIENKALFGRLSNIGRHFITEPMNVRIQTAERGYFESGFTLSRIKILDQFWGVGVFYGYGPYQQNRWYDNLAFKLLAGI